MFQLLLIQNAIHDMIQLLRVKSSLEFYLFKFRFGSVNTVHVLHLKIFMKNATKAYIGQEIID